MCYTVSYIKCQDNVCGRTLKTGRKYCWKHRGVNISEGFRINKQDVNRLTIFAVFAALTLIAMKLQGTMEKVNNFLGGFHLSVYSVVMIALYIGALTFLFVVLKKSGWIMRISVVGFLSFIIGLALFG